MTWCEQQFVAFNERLKLDDARLGRINGALTHFNEFCLADEELSYFSAGGIFTQGSVPARTVVKPLASGDFDVDVVYPFNLQEFGVQASPQSILDWFVARLRRDNFYIGNMIPKDRCVRIEYAGDFHLDLIPATPSLQDLQPYVVPAKDLGGWIANDPLGFVKWIKERDSNSQGKDAEGDGRFVRCVRYVKRWRDEFFDDDSAPSSILLSTFLGKHEASVKSYNPPLEVPLYPEYQTDAAYLYDLLRLTHSCIKGASGSAYQHPTLPEDLGAEWRVNYESMFMDRLHTCIVEVGRAIWAKEEGASITHYKRALGDTFPDR